MRNRYCKYILGGLLMLLTGCFNAEQLSIDYMLPAEISFPSALRRVAIVNNMPFVNADSTLISERHERFKGGGERTVKFHHGNAIYAAEALAETIADENFFDEVVICDSALRYQDTILRESALTQTEVEELTEALDVDFLISIENVLVKSTRQVIYYWRAGFQGLVTASVYPTIKVYLPGRRTAMTTLTCNDSIDWDQMTYDGSRALEGLINDADMVKEASDFAGTLPVKQLLPTWRKSNRVIFTNGSTTMRDAYHYVREEEWEKAITLWEQLYNSEKKPKKRLWAAYNLALGHEMLDNIEASLEWVIRAEQLAKEVDKRTAEQDVRLGNTLSYSLLTHRYKAELEQRKTQLPRLKAQMSRFTEGN